MMVHFIRVLWTQNQSFSSYLTGDVYVILSTLVYDALKTTDEEIMKKIRLRAAGN